MYKGDHWACKKCLVRPCCTKICYKGDMIHFLCEDCKEGCDRRVSIHWTRWTSSSCGKIRQHEYFQRLAEKYIPMAIKHMEENNPLLRLMKMQKEQRRNVS